MILNQLKGAKLEQINMTGSDLSSGDVELKFDQGSLCIFNTVKVACDNGFPVDIQTLTGTTLTAFYTNTDQLALVFADRLYLKISLREEDFVRAEAMILRCNSGEVIAFP